MSDLPSRSVPLPQEVVERHTLGQVLIPVRAARKKASLVGWKDLTSDRPDLAQLRRWHSEFPDAMWAALTGEASGFITLDFDGDAGRETLARLGLTPHRRTPRGGYHVDVMMPPYKVRTIANGTDPRLAEGFPGLDLRGDGGYVAIWGTNPDGTYEALRDMTPEPFEMVPAELVPLLGQRTSSKPRATHASTKATTTTTSPANPTTKVSEATTATTEQDELAGNLIRQAWQMLDGGAARNDTGFWLACQLRDHGVPEDQAFIHGENYRLGTGETDTAGHLDPYTEAEVIASVHSAYTEAPREPFLAETVAPGIIVNADVQEGDLVVEILDRLAESNDPPSLFEQGGGSSVSAPMIEPVTGSRR